MKNPIHTLISGLTSSKETAVTSTVQAKVQPEPKLSSSRLATRVLLAAAIGGGSVGATSLGACAGPDFTVGEAEIDSGVVSTDARTDSVNNEVSVDSAAEAEVVDPCAAAADGFKVKVKALTARGNDWVLFDEKGNAIKDSLSNGKFERDDFVIEGVKYGYVLVEQVAPDISNLGADTYAAEHEVDLPAACIGELASSKGHSTASTASPTAFKNYYDTCPTVCTPVDSLGVKPTFHFEYAGVSPLNKSTFYYINFKKP